MSLANRTAVVTGSTSGIGLAVARALGAAGANVMLSGFGEPAAIEAIRAEIEAGSAAIVMQNRTLRELRESLGMTQDEFAPILAAAEQAAARPPPSQPSGPRSRPGASAASIRGPT